jgi:2-phosphosulfolactate phosphatase
MWIDVALDHASTKTRCPDVWIAIDILRATSVMTTFLAEGGDTLYLAADVEEARALASQLHLLTMGERFAKPIEGFDFDNSPLQLLEAKGRLKGRNGVHTTSNGTKLIRLLQSMGGEILAGSFLNLSACASAAVKLATANSSKGITIACAGRRGSPILDDTYCAGVFVKRLSELLAEAELTDGAMLALAVSEALPLEQALRESESGHIVANLGLSEEIAFCARIDVYSCVPYASNVGGLLAMKRVWPPSQRVAPGEPTT